MKKSNFSMRIFAVMLVAVLLMCAIHAMAFAQTREEYKLFLNDDELQTDVSAFIIDGGVDGEYVPLRVVIEALGGEVAWDNVARAVTVTYGDKTAVLQIGSSVAIVGTTTLELYAPTIIVDGRTMIEIDFIGDFFNHIHADTYAHAVANHLDKTIRILKNWL
jgi:hypothetical protein